jgi:hypothetical protein
VTDGVYDVFCQTRANPAVNGGIAAGATTYADGTHLLPFLGFTNGPDYGLSGGSWFAAGTNIVFWFYNNGSNTNTNFALRPAMLSIWKRNAQK